MTSIKLDVFWVTIFTCTCIVQQHQVSSADATIYIDAFNGVDSITCLQRTDNEQSPCRSIEYALRVDARYHDTRYVFVEGIHNLGTPIPPFQNIFNLDFIGSGQSRNNTKIRCTSQSGGMSFESSGYIRFAHLSFVNCSHHITNGPAGSDWYKSNTALFINDCIQVAIYDVRIANSPNGTGLVMINTAGVNKISNSMFDNNDRGVHIQITTNSRTIQPTTYSISNSIFEKNSAIDERHPRQCVPPSEQTHMYDYGGGMSLVMQSNVIMVNFQLVDSYVIQNKGACGGGFYIVMGYPIIQNAINLRITNVYFQENSCPFSNSLVTFGGGMRFEYLNKPTNLINTSPVSLNIRECTFVGNTAFSGGGLSMYLSALYDGTQNQLTVDIANTVFSNNTAEVGAAVEASLLVLGNRTTSPFVLITNSKFMYNSISKHDQDTEPSQSGVGAVYTNKIHFSFQNQLVFYRNKGSALAIAGTYVDFVNCRANFSNNHGVNGGAIALLGSADMVINDNTNMTFQSNHASISGGAIYNVYIEKENLAAYHNCFIRHIVPSTHPSDWRTSMYFLENSASLSGSSIYSTSILPCQLNSPFVFDKGNVLCLGRWTYRQNNTQTMCSTEISTAAGKVFFYGHTNFSVIPGQVFKLGLETIDDLLHNVSKDTIFTAQVPTDYRDVASVDARYRYVSVRELAVNGVPGSNFSVLLSTTGERLWHVSIDVELLDCPPGLKLSTPSPTASSYCECDQSNIFMGRVRCNQARRKSYLLHGYWMGTLDDESLENTSSRFVVSECPPGFCNYMHLELPKNSHSLEETICGHKLNRRGTVCGQCKENYGPAVNSDTYQCVYCKGSVPANVVYYILSVYVPLLILFSLMIIFKVRLTTGPANAFIFYSQVISSNFNLNADGHIPWRNFTDHPKTFERVYRSPYGLFNLEFIENFIRPLCIGSRLSALDILQLDYFVAITPLAMIFIVLLCFKVKKCCDKVTPAQVTTCCRTAVSFQARLKLGENLLQAFASFLLLSYTKLGLTSAYILNNNPVIDVNGDHVGPNRVYYAGEYKLTDKEYVFRYLLPACFVLAVVAIVPLVLLGIPVIWLEKCLFRFPKVWMLYPASKVHILLDTFQGCYRNKRRFFAGVYFIFHFVLNIVYIFTPNLMQRFVVQQVVCTIFIVIVALCWPYKENMRVLNYIDLLIFINLAVINSISLYMYNHTHSSLDHSVPVNAFIIQYILALLPLVYIIVYVLWILTAKRRNKIIGFFKHLYTRRNVREYSDLSEDDEGIVRQIEPDMSGAQGQDPACTFSEVMMEQSEDYDRIQNEDERLFIRAKATNTYKPVSYNNAEGDSTQELPYKELQHTHTWSHRNFSNSSELPPVV